MAEYDAFGREKGEDTLAGLGTPSSGGGSTPQPTVATPEAAAPQPSTTGFAGPRPERPSPNLGRIFKVGVFVVVLAVIGSVVVSIVAAVHTGVDTVNKVKPIFDGLTVPTTASVPTPSAAASDGSFLRRADFARALRRLERMKATGPARFLRVDADRVSGQLVGPGGKLVVVTATATSTQTITTSATVPGATVKLRRIHPAAPERIARALRRRGQRVDYLVLSGLAGAPEWRAYTPSGRTYRADLRGRGVR